MLTLYPAALLNVFIRCNSLLGETFVENLNYLPVLKNKIAFTTATREV
jgi:hypothetical protein